ncbi:ribose ABC transporter [Streptomyces abyssalis]|uniref:D-ribose pyranase n=1 Tax=Streptomyces abyssalis TaxID=933944 RepID=A0A1E7JJL9_9ACTN|nr:D-ribose pyranase [Streptomyces abyssalis]OEU87293.1 ribose ABC transporter [Streptomyces abyssalis]OEU87825.1 ribose ABC transporter [Streptomyces abyssalis]OEV29139.1 ribose ABC transporter [Streptomyces nanshensis]
MKKSGILNRHLAGALAMLGHTDRVVVCDAGFPVPVAPGLMIVDLAFRAGVPPFAEVLSGLLDELETEGAMAASEIKDRNPEASALLDGLFPSLELVPHEEFKARARGARLVVRTGEVRPYANVMLHCGVPF